MTNGLRASPMNNVGALTVILCHAKPTKTVEKVSSARKESVTHFSKQKTMAAIATNGHRVGKRANVLETNVSLRVVIETLTAQLGSVAGTKNA